MVALVSAAQPADALNVATYVEGNDEVVHPSVVDAGTAGWNGHRYWMAATPYPNGDNAFENPSVWVSGDGSSWTVPDGAVNPVVPAPSSGYWSDPCLVLDGSIMYLYYRGVGTGSPLTNGEGVLVRSSTDGVTWSSATACINVDPAAIRCLSPAVVNDNGTWRMWFVDTIPTPFVVHMCTSNSATGAFAPASVCQLPAPDGKQLWHLSVQRRGTYWMLLNVTNPSSSAGGLMYVADSADGVTWNRRNSPLLSTRGNKWDASIYAGCWTAAGAGWDVWYSSSSPNWAIGRTSVGVHPIPRSGP